MAEHPVLNLHRAMERCPLAELNLFPLALRAQRREKFLEKVHSFQSSLPITGDQLDFFAGFGAGRSTDLR